MTISEALAFLQLRCWSLTIRSKSARCYLRGKWAISVRAKGCESIEKMVVRLAMKAQLHDQFKHAPEPPPKPGRRTKAHLRRLRDPLPVN